MPPDFMVDESDVIALAGEDRGEKLGFGEGQNPETDTEAARRPNGGEAAVDTGGGRIPSPTGKIGNQLL